MITSFSTCASLSRKVSYNTSVAQLLYNYNCNQALSGSNLYNSVNQSFDGATVNASIDATYKKYGASSISILQTTSYIDVKNKVNFGSGSGKYSFAMWFKTSKNNSTDYVHLAVFSANDVNGTNPSSYADSTMLRIVNGVDNNTINMRNSTGGVVSTANISAPSGFSGIIKDNTWHHIVWSGFGNSSSTSLYVDGVYWGAFSLTPVTFNATGNTSRLGQASWSLGVGVIGYLDEIQIYSDTLSTGQVNAIYAGGAA